MFMKRVGEWWTCVSVDDCMMSTRDCWMSLLLPFTTCIKPLKEVCDAFLKAVQFSTRCAENCLNMVRMC
ncbi:hypothetical protein ACOMHN_032252 [Nucella lapillus]